MKALAKETLPMSTDQNPLEAENAALRQLQAALESATAHYVSLLDAERGQFRALLQSVLAQDADGALQLRIVLSDITPARQHDIPDAGAGVTRPERADLTESQLRAKIGHDLRQPLSALGIYATVLKNHVAPAGQPLLAHIQLCLVNLSELLAK